MDDRRLYLGPLTDNRRWDSIALRPDDVIVVTPPKCGTTWLQTIVALLLSGDPDVAPDPSDRMPWVDMRHRDLTELAARLEAMTHRRCLKSHTPLDGLPLHDKAQYLCVFRHPLDAHFSFRNHARNMPLPVFETCYPRDDPDGAIFQRFLAGEPEGFDMDVLSLRHILRHYQVASALAEKGNVTLFHYADMWRDLPGTFAQVANLLGVVYPSDLLTRLIQSAGFDHMKAEASRYAPSGGRGFMRSDSDFFHSGKCGQWRDRLSSDELSAYDTVMDAHLPPAARGWLEYGATGCPND